MKTLVITEKPSVAKDIASVLGRFESKDGYLENNEYLISWAFGHLVELADPSVYDLALTKWALETLPIIPNTFKLTEIGGSSAKQLRALKKLLNSPEVSQVINACDAGREGELIFRRIYRYCGCRKLIKRLWLSETTPAAVKAAFAALRDGREYNNLAAAAEARSQADWLVGINGTRAFSVRHNTVLSVGRVQTPTLNLVVSREKEIQNFVSKPYWEVYAVFKANGGTYRGKWFTKETGKLNDSQTARALADKVARQGVGKIITLVQKEAKEQPPFLFNLNDLQKESNRRYGYTAQQTLDIAQALYEKHKLLTYPRTDSRHLSTAMVTTLAGRLAALKDMPEYKDFIPAQIPDLDKRYVDDAKITDHHAIIPTDRNPAEVQLNDQEEKIYDLVVRRFLSIFYPEARYAVTEVVTQAAGEIFGSKGKVELDAGWKVLWRDKQQEQKEDDEEQEDQNLPPLSQWENVVVVKAEPVEKQTKPPKRFTEATLLAAMESAGRFTEDKEMAEVLKEAGGIGTPATRAAIIERLIKVGYLVREKKSLVPTPKGMTLIDLVPEQLKSVEMTANWEEGLRRIEQGQENSAAWMKSICEYTRHLVELARNQETANGIVLEKKALGNCPVCGRDVVETTKGYGCSGYKDGCKFTIWKEIAGKKITPKQAGDLLSKGKTGIIKGFKGKSGKSFDAILVIREGGKIEFSFPDRSLSPDKTGTQKNETSRNTLGKCPICGREVLENSRGFGCSGYQDGCKFTIWKEISGKKIGITAVRELLVKGRTGILKGFKSKAGKEFEAALVISNGKVEFEFTRKN
ncbi:type IA DNA topoisomerase [Desulfotomaculum varum]